MLSRGIYTFNTVGLGGPEEGCETGAWRRDSREDGRRRLLVLLHEVGVEHAELLHHQLQLVRLRQDRAAEVIGARLLAKSAARNNANACLEREREREMRISTPG